MKFDFETTQERSALMSKIKAKNTKPELKLRKALWSSGVRYRINYKKLPGCPDIFVSKYRIAIFVDGEFWHGKEWEQKKLKLKANRDYWIKKIERNIERDREIDYRLNALNFTVLRFWSLDVEKSLGRCVKPVLDLIYEFQYKGVM